MGNSVRHCRLCRCCRAGQPSAAAVAALRAAPRQSSIQGEWVPAPRFSSVRNPPSCHATLALPVLHIYIGGAVGNLSVASHCQSGMHPRAACGPRRHLCRAHNQGVLHTALPDASPFVLRPKHCSTFQVSGTAGEASHPAPHTAGIHRKSASAAVASSGGGATTAARHDRRSIGGRTEGAQLHSIDSGASDELGGPEPTLGHPPPNAGGNGAVNGGGGDSAVNSTAAGVSTSSEPQPHEQ